jgi:hypothetical protein
MSAGTGCEVLVRLKANLNSAFAEYDRCVDELQQFADSSLFGPALQKCTLARRRYLELKEAVREHEETHRCTHPFFQRETSRNAQPDESG